MTALLLILAWSIGQVWTDRFHITQYLWWMPTPIVLVLAWVLVILSWLFERFSIRLGGYLLRPVLSALLLGLALWFVFGVGHVHRFVLPTSRGTMRLVYWNLAVDGGASGAGKVVTQLKPDLAIVANPRWDQTRAPLMEALRSIAQGDAEPAGSDQSAVPAGFLFHNEIALATRGNILRWGATRFHIGPRDDYEHRGVVLFAEIDGIAPEPVTLWVVDLPSAPELWRREVMQAARSAVASWNGPEFVYDPDAGRWTPRVESGRFADPDLIVGDFNTPRGSESLQILVGSMKNAASAGRGFGYTWPRRRAVLAIDQCFVGDRLAPRTLRTIDPGMGRHRLVMVDLVPG